MQAMAPASADTANSQPNMPMWKGLSLDLAEPKARRARWRIL